MQPACHETFTSHSEKIAGPAQSCIAGWNRLCLTCRVGCGIAPRGSGGFYGKHGQARRDGGSGGTRAAGSALSRASALSRGLTRRVCRIGPRRGRADELPTSASIPTTPARCSRPRLRCRRPGLYAFEPYVIETSQSRQVRRARRSLAILRRDLVDRDLDPDEIRSSPIISRSSCCRSRRSTRNRIRGFNSGSQAGDLPIELEYRFIDQDKVTGKPSITASAGVDVPTGRYKNLYSAFDGQGAGTYRGRFGLLAQSLLYRPEPAPRAHPRLRSTSRSPFGSTSDHRTSRRFGTNTGFNGTGYTGLSGTTGMPASSTRSPSAWSSAADIFYAAGKLQRRLRLPGHGARLACAAAHFDDLQLAPAFEYNVQRRVRHHRGRRLLRRGPQHVIRSCSRRSPSTSCSTRTKPLGGIPCPVQGPAGQRGHRPALMTGRPPAPTARRPAIEPPRRPGHFRARPRCFSRRAAQGHRRETHMSIGFIGLGSMGVGIAANLVKAGHEVTVWNRSPGKAEEPRGGRRAGGELRRPRRRRTLASSSPCCRTMPRCSPCCAARRGS